MKLNSGQSAKQTARIFPGYLTLLLTLFLAACAGTPTPLPLPVLTSSAEPMTEEVFSVGYQAISDKYIERKTVAHVATEGLKGLTSIDPDITITHNGDKLYLKYDNKIHSVYPVAATNDAQEWASLTTKIITQSLSFSSSLRTASPEKIYEAVFDGSLSTLDAFSRYAGAIDAKRNRDKREGFGGIGILHKINRLSHYITNVLEGSPADKAGLVMGDEILSIEGQSVLLMGVSEVSSLIKGPTLSDLHITIQTQDIDGPSEFIIKRTHIVPESVFASNQNGILYLKVKTFNQNTATSIQDQIEKFSAQSPTPSKGLIIDLRGNPGGLLKQSVKAADLLINDGNIISTRGRHPSSYHQYQAEDGDVSGGLPVIVMIDGRSASAAEILAAALQDQERAVVIGTSSYGKGSVQTVVRLPNDGEITLTWSRFTAPSGYLLHGLGVRPVICTSGSNIANKETPTQRVLQALEQAPQTVATLNIWRLANFPSRERRYTLRKTCPAQGRINTRDIESARYILNNEALYDRALDLGSTKNLTAKTHDDELEQSGDQTNGQTD